MIVVLSCTHEQHHFKPGALQILNCEEDMQGADVVTFTCPVCGENHKSRVYGRAETDVEALPKSWK